MRLVRKRDRQTPTDDDVDELIDVEILGQALHPVRQRPLVSPQVQRRRHRDVSGGCGGVSVKGHRHGDPSQAAGYATTSTAPLIADRVIASNVRAFATISSNGIG